ncbi:MAG: hypothetical protein M3O24_00265 [Thermoproteota archaeon]|nr:hypothetical protein [Thermoproteota archaeon]
MTSLPCKKHENKWDGHDGSGDKYWLKLGHIHRNPGGKKVRKRIQPRDKEPQGNKECYERKVLSNETSTSFPNRTTMYAPISFLTHTR